MIGEIVRARVLEPWRRLRRPLLTLSLLLALCTYALLVLFTDVSWRSGFIAAWDVGANFALVALFFELRNSSAETMKENAIRWDAGKWIVLIFTLAAATASLVAITAEMPLVKTAGGVERAARVILVIYTVVLSWAFIHTMFAMHYAHDFYVDLDVAAARRGSGAERLIFPGNQMPTYGDFLYFSFTIGMTFQVSDVQISDPGMRRPRARSRHGRVLLPYRYPRPGDQLGRRSDLRTCCRRHRSRRRAARRTWRMLARRDPGRRNPDKA